MLLYKGHFTHERKSRDRVIVRAQKKVYKGRSKTSPKSRGVVMDCQVRCEVVYDQALNQLLVSIHVGPRVC
jgi:hypothetical protein